jgi:DNA-binding NtrC family response regulator
MPGRAAVAGPSSTDDQAADTAWPTLADVERIHLERTLAATMQNKSLAAKLLGIDRSVLRRKLQRYGMEGQPGEEPAGPDSARP